MDAAVMVHVSRERYGWGVFSCSVKTIPKKRFSSLYPTASLVYSCIERIQSTKHKVQDVPEVPAMFCNHLSFLFHSSGPLRLEALWVDITATLQQWANAVPGPSASWKLFFLEA
jgi:hypothetical protein